MSIDLEKVDELVDKLRDKVKNPSINLEIAKPTEKKEKEHDPYKYRRRPRNHESNRRKLWE